MKEPNVYRFGKGKYYIGDPCYAMSHEEWRDLLQETEYLKEDINVWNDHKIFTHSTAFGDGEYYDEFGRPYGVDSGMIGIIPLSAINLRQKSLVGGWEIEFENAFDVMYESGCFTFGHIRINTDDDSDDYEWEDDEYDDEYDDGEYDEQQKSDT
jgi:hypothetical protein